MLRSTPKTSRALDIICSIPGLSKISAAALLIEMPELGTLNPDEAITLEQALVVVTLGSAQVLGADKTIGSIERGKFADLIVLDQNLFEIKPTDIGDTKVMNTIVGGEVVYSRAVLGNEDFKTNKEPFSH